jgi:hypothetical protein
MIPVLFVSMVRGVKMDDDELQGMQTVTMVYYSTFFCKDRTEKYTVF